MRKSITFDEALQDPAQQDMWEVIRFLENHEGDILFPEKFLASHQDRILQKIQRLQEHSPALTLKDALVEILKDIPETVPADLLIQLTRFTIEQWEARSFAISKEQA